MKTKIENDKEFTEAIDTLGKLNDEMNSLKSEAKVLKELIDSYANANGITRFAADEYKLLMKKASARLYMLPGMQTEDVVAKMKRDEIGKGYLYTNYNAEAIKSDKVDDETLEKWGLALSSSVKHAAISRK